jgi:hypothetical protein
MCRDFTLLLQELILEVILSEECYINMGPILCGLKNI